MPALHKLSLAMVCVALSGCMSMPVESLKKPAPEKAGELLVYRVSAFSAALTSATVGTNNTAFAHLDSKEYAIVQLPEGEHEIFVRDRNYAENTINIKLVAGTRVCMRIRSDSGRALLDARSPVGILGTGYWYIPFVIECPEDEKFFTSYKQVKIQYAEQP